MLCGLFLAGSVAFAPAASAHDELIDSEPGDTDTVSAPEEIVLTFNANVLEVGAAVEVEGPDGSVVDGEITVDGPTVTQGLQEDIAAGDYEVAWRVTSSDGHPISDTFGFTVEGDDAGEDDGAAGDEGDAATDGAESPAVDDETDADAPDEGAGGTEDTNDADGAEPTDDAATEATEEDADDAVPAATEEPAETDAETDAETAAPSPSEAEENGDEADGMPLWGWILIGIALIALAGLVVAWSRRARSEDTDLEDPRDDTRD